MAINERGKRIFPANLPRNKLLELRKQTFFCPFCKEKVIFRFGQQVIPHFAHHPRSICEIERINESLYHKRAKIQLYQWFQKQRIPTQLEKYFPSILQRADLFIKYNNREIVLEFQSSSISSKNIRKRIEGYNELNINQIWLIGSNQLTQVKPYTFRISPYIIPILNLMKDSPSKITYYCPNQKRFTILTDLHVIRSNLAVALPHHVFLPHASFHHLFPKTYFPIKKLLKLWLAEKKTFRLSSYPVYGKELKFRKWLYQHKLHVEQLPSVIHLPIRMQYKMNVPLWHWQSKLIINLIHPLPVGSIINKRSCINEIIPYVNEYDEKVAEEVIEQYFIYLTAGRWFKRENKISWRKLRHFRFYRYIEQSVQGDQLFIQYLTNQFSNKYMHYYMNKENTVE